MIYTIRCDEVSTTDMYLGKASSGSLESDPVWQLQKITTTGTVLEVKFPSGDVGFNFVWDARSSYTYQ